MRSIGIVNYGTGNVGSLLTVFKSLGIYAEILSEADQITKPDLLVLPGVGAAGTTMQQMESSGITEAMRERRAAARPILGICLGAQLFCRFHREGECAGLGWIMTDVEPLQKYPFFNNGWCQLDFDALRAVGLARALSARSAFYFNHRYVMGHDEKMDSVSVAKQPDLPAIYLDGPICALQFHPEKSQRDGRILLRNLMEDHYGL